MTRNLLLILGGKVSFHFKTQDELIFMSHFYIEDTQKTFSAEYFSTWHSIYLYVIRLFENILVYENTNKKFSY